MVQLEKGSVASPFARRNVGEELALCQRYYYRTPNIYALGQIYNASPAQGYFLIPFPTTMRIAPPSTGPNSGAPEISTASNYSMTTASGTTISLFMLYQTASTPNSSQVFAMVLSGGTWTVGTMSWLYGNGNYMAWNVEL